MTTWEFQTHVGKVEDCPMSRITFTSYIDFLKLPFKWILKKKNWVDTSDLSELEALPDSEKRLCTSTPPHRLYPSVLIYSLILPFTHRLLPTTDGQLCLLVPNDAKWFYYMDRCPLAGRKGFAKPFLSLYLQKKYFEPEFSELKG